MDHEADIRTEASRRMERKDDADAPRDPALGARPGESAAAQGGGTVGKALAVLDAVAGAGRPLRFSEVQALFDHPKATLHRLLQTLVAQGMLAYTAERQTYAPGMRLVRLAHAAWAQSSLAPLARPFVDALSEEVGETIHLAQLSEGQVLYVDKRNARKPIEMFSDAGKVGPGYCTGVGKAMLAFLPEEERQTAIRQQSFYRHTGNTLDTPDKLETVLTEIRHTGVSYDREEHEPGIICIAVPILAAQGRVLGALSITGTTRDVDYAGLDAYRPALQSTAAEIAAAAEAWQFPG
ncbi:MAG: IclR family transcriptional regulator [Pseudomonadota bacterium]